MDLIRENELGKLEINEITFAGLLRDAVDKTDGKIFLSSSDGRLLGGFDKRVSLNEAVKNMSFIFDSERNLIEWEFYTIIAFGQSISDVTEFVFDYLEVNLKESFPDFSWHLLLRVRGMRAKQVVYRDLVFERRYNSEH